jgi:hypothetical protein
MALCIGLWASARGFERLRTAWAALLLLVGLVLGPSLLGAVLPRTHLELASPMAAILHAGDLAYRASPGSYWISLGLVQVIGWGLLLAASIGLGGRMDKNNKPIISGAPLGHTIGYSAASALTVADGSPASSGPIASFEIRCSYCGRQNNTKAIFCDECGTELRPKILERPGSWTLSSAPTPLHWLLSRQRGLKPLLWVAACIACFHLTILQLLSRFAGFGMGTFFFGAFNIFGLAETTIQGSLLAWIASRFLIEARRTGELELLLTTPLGAEKLVSTQWETLKRLARGPVLLMVGLPLILESLFIGVYAPSTLLRLYYPLSLLLSTANTILNVGALFWLAPWLGLQIVGQGRVIFWTVLLVRGLPYAASLAWSLIYQSLMSWGVQSNVWPGSPWLLGFLVPRAATILFYWWLIGVARSQLLHLPGTEPVEPSRILLRPLVQIVRFIGRARTWRPV